MSCVHSDLLLGGVSEEGLALWHCGGCELCLLFGGLLCLSLCEILKLLSTVLWDAVHYVKVWMIGCHFFTFEEGNEADLQSGSGFNLGLGFRLEERNVTDLDRGAEKTHESEAEKTRDDKDRRQNVEAAGEVQLLDAKVA